MVLSSSPRFRLNRIEAMLTQTALTAQQLNSLTQELQLIRTVVQGRADSLPKQVLLGQIATIEHQVTNYGQPPALTATAMDLN